jgi:SPP1 family predicted phage head-tail adaptor
MYLTPGTLNKTFDWQSRTSDKDTRGKPIYSYVDTGQIIGVLANSTPVQQLQYNQLDHPVTHQIVVHGAPQAVSGDRLLFNGQRFYVQTTEDLGGLGLWTLYMVQERNDA